MYRLRLHSKMSRREGKLILKYMQEIIDRYGYATVADLYDLIDLKPLYIHSRSGWNSLKSAKVSLLRKNHAYELILPYSEHIDSMK